MPRYSQSLVAPKFRHLFPVAPELSFRVSGMVPTRPASIPIVTFASVGEWTYQLPELEDNEYRETGSIRVEFNNVPVSNEFKILSYDQGEPQWGYETFYYDPETRTVVFDAVIPTGMLVAIYEMPVQGDDFYRLRLPRHVLVQGARKFPDPPQRAGDPEPELTKFPDHIGMNEPEILVLPDDGPAGQFLGGFRCNLEILTPCVHGQVRIGVNRISFEYRPLFGFSGRDSFSYRVVTALGQQSDASCIQLFVGV